MIAAEGEEIVESLFGLGCGVDDRGLVRAQDSEPVGDIARMIVVELIGQSELCADETAADLGDQLLECVCLVPKPLAERPREAGGAARPMGVMPISA